MVHFVFTDQIGIGTGNMGIGMIGIGPHGLGMVGHHGGMNGLGSGFGGVGHVWGHQSVGSGLLGGLSVLLPSFFSSLAGDLRPRRLQFSKATVLCFLPGLPLSLMHPM